MFDLKEMGVVLTASPYTQRWFHQGIGSYQDWFGGPIILVYMDDDADMLPLSDFMPPVTHVITPGVIGHRTGELWGIKCGVEKLRELGIRYVYKSAADIAVHRHHVFEVLHECLTECDAEILAIDACVHFFGLTDRICDMFSDIHTIAEMQNLVRPRPAEATFRGLMRRCTLRQAEATHQFRDSHPPDIKKWDYWHVLLGRHHIHGLYARIKQQQTGQRFGPREAWQDGIIWPRAEKLPVEATIRYRDAVYEIHGVSDNDLMISRFRKSSNFYELQLLEEVSKLQLEGIYLDLGANIGNHLIFFANHCPSEKVVGVEAQPETLEVLRYNARKHLRKRFDLWNLAVTDTEGFADLQPIKYSNVGGARVLGVKEVGAVRCQTLNWFLEKYSNVSLIKMDIEGWELRIVKASLDRIAERRPVVITEFSKELHDEYLECEQLFRSIGYKVSGAWCNTPTYIWLPVDKNFPSIGRTRDL